MINSSASIKQQFNIHFNSSPKIFFAPGRINLIGEHIDYNNGFVMPAAIDKGVWFAIAKNDKNSINVFSADMKEWMKMDLDKIEKQNGWKNYLLGVVTELQKKNFKLHGFDCVFAGNIPVGAGLSSSAAVEGGLGKALNELFDLKISNVDIALMGQKAENNYVGVQCGIMDQFANMMGEKDKVIFLDCDSLEYKTLPLQLNEYEILLINSKVHHSLASSEYNVRREESEAGFKIIQQHFAAVKSFRDVNEEQILSIKNLFEGKSFERCLFVIQEIERTKKAAEHLKANELKAFGSLMFEAHEGLSKKYEVSCIELDFLVEQTKNFPEIIGSRMMGGGFGGCTINIIKKENTKEISSKIISAYKEKFQIDAEVYKVQTGDGTHEVIDKY